MPPELSRRVLSGTDLAYEVVNYAFLRYGLDGLGIESRWGEIFHTVQTGSEAHPASYIVGTGSFQGVKGPGRGVRHAHPSRAAVKEKVVLHLFSTSGPSLPVKG
jgi:hypothetical protein